MALATFLVVGMSSSDSLSLANERLWIQQCSQETGFQPPGTTDPSALVTDRKELCFAACYLRKEGMMMNEKLVGREKVCDILADLATGHRLQLKDGKTIRQLTEQCYDEAKLKTEVCEIAGALINCLREGVISAVPIQ